MFKSIANNKMKTAFIVAMVTAFLAVIVYYISYATGYGEIALPMAVVIALGSSLVSYFNCDKMVLAISGARPADQASDRLVKNTIEGLCIAAGLPMPKVYIIDDPVANAFATGRDPKHAVVAVTTGLLEKMDSYELEGVLAHELAHIGNRDILLSTVVTVMVGIAVIISDMWSRMLFWGGGRRRSDNDNNGSNAILVIIGLVFMILAPLAGQLMKMALSRNREYLADATAVKFTRNPDGLISALRKLSSQTEPVSRATNATANLYITNPMNALNGKKVSNLFSTHPPIEERIEALRNLQ
ncbi:MAG: M48 family metalloprotease [Eubacteriales bacterium]|nr:M48 family metalloprotease [Eubacteriales bacterium]